MTYAKINIRILFLLSGIFFFQGLRAQEKVPAEPLPLFQSDTLLELELKADFDLVFSVTDDSTYFPARATLADNEGRMHTFDVEVRTRGNTRRQDDICPFPPLRLRFPEKEMKDTPFKGQKAIKLVTHCNKTGQFEQNTIKEYLIYKAFNILTDSSLMVRAVMINYIDSKKETDTLRRFAFFIEREKHLAERLGAIELEPDKIRPDRIDPAQSCLVDIFQYMVGNTDYSIFELHNIVLFSDTAADETAIPVPYDFDWSGLVAAHYAVPHPLMGTESVTERVYRGLKQEPEIVFHAVSVFRAREKEIYQLFENYDLLDKKEKKFISRYLEDFFSMLEKERSVENEFIRNARQVEK